MPFCVQCGHQVSDEDRFCAKCGNPQKDPQKHPQKEEKGTAANFWDSVSQRNAILFCYLPWVGWIAAIAVLGSARFRGEHRARFHAFQGLYLFVAWLMVEWVVSPMFGFAGPARPQLYRVIPQLLHLAVFAAWIFMIVKVSHDEDYRLPILGELAKRSAAEQH